MLKLYFNSQLAPNTNIQKGIIVLTVKGKTVKLLEESIRENLCDLGLGKDFLDMT